MRSQDSGVFVLKRNNSCMDVISKPWCPLVSLANGVPFLQTMHDCILKSDLKYMNMKPRWRYGFQVLPWVLQLVPFQQMQVLEIQSCMHLCIVGMHACCSTFVFHVAVFFSVSSMSTNKRSRDGKDKARVAWWLFWVVCARFFWFVKLIMVNLEEAIYRAAMAPPIQILPATVSEMPLIGIMNLYMHVGVSEKKLICHPHQNAGWPIELGSGARTTWGMDLNFYHRC